MCHPDQMHKRIRRPYAGHVALGPQRIAVHDLAAGRNPGFGARPHQRAHAVTAAQQLRRQPASHKAGAPVRNTSPGDFYAPPAVPQPPNLVRLEGNFRLDLRGKRGGTQETGHLWGRVNSGAKLPGWRLLALDEGSGNLRPAASPAPRAPSLVSRHLPSRPERCGSPTRAEEKSLAGAALRPGRERTPRCGPVRGLTRFTGPRRLPLF